jgi:hypothetical protein
MVLLQDKRPFRERKERLLSISKSPTEFLQRAETFNPTAWFKALLCYPYVEVWFGHGSFSTSKVGETPLLVASNRAAVVLERLAGCKMYLEDQCEHPLPSLAFWTLTMPMDPAPL